MLHDIATLVLRFSPLFYFSLHIATVLLICFALSFNIVSILSLSFQTTLVSNLTLQSSMLPLPLTHFPHTRYSYWCSWNVQMDLGEDHLDTDSLKRAKKNELLDRTQLLYWKPRTASPADPLVSLKLGCKVMLWRNLQPRNFHLNGTQYIIDLMIFDFLFSLLDWEAKKKNDSSFSKFRTTLETMIFRFLVSGEFSSLFASAFQSH